MEITTKSPTRKCIKCKLRKTLFEFREKIKSYKGRDYICQECFDKNYIKPIITERTCYKCKFVKPLDKFRNRSSNPLGKDYLCKECQKQIKRNRTQKKIKNIETVPNQRTCYSCKEIKNLTDFVKRTQNKFGYSYECKCCKNIKKRKPTNKLKQPLWVSRLKHTLTKRSKKYKVENITSEFLNSLYEKQDGKCYYTGIKMSIINPKKNLFQISLDRLDSNLGYAQNNVVLCCYGINLCKSDTTEKDFLEFLTQIRNTERI